MVATQAAFRYTGPVAAAVVAGKVRGAAAVWAPLGRLLGEVVAAAADPPDAVTWVPTDPRRRRRRGLDHAELLARAVGARIGRPAVGMLRARPGRPDQASRPVARRAAVYPGAFVALGPCPGRLLLVDDVLTSGGTARAAASALRCGGASGVHLAVLARAGDHRLAGAAAARSPASPGHVG